MRVLAAFFCTFALTLTSSANASFLLFPSLDTSGANSLPGHVFNDVSGIMIKFTGSYVVNHPAFAMQNDGTTPWEHIALERGALARITIPSEIDVDTLFLYDVDEASGLEIVMVDADGVNVATIQNEGINTKNSDAVSALNRDVVQIHDGTTEIRLISLGDHRGLSFFQLEFEEGQDEEEVEFAGELPEPSSVIAMGLLLVPALIAGCVRRRRQR